MSTSTTQSRARRHGAATLLVAAAVGVGLALPATPALAAGPAAAAPSTATPSAVTPSTIAPLAQACPEPATGHVGCLSKFRTAGSAARAGVPANTDATAVQVGGKTVAPPTAGYGPADIKKIYGLNTSQGSGRTVAIVDAYDNPNAESDLAAFRAAYKLPPCTTKNGCFTKVNQRGGSTPPAPDAGWGVEIALDVQAVSAACPKCRILLVEADSSSLDDIGAAVNRAVAMGAKIVSNSYGGSEFNGVVDLGTQYYTHKGVAMVVSSGDSGFGPAEFPASWNKSIAVGGTTVTKTATGYTHSAWWGAGSGCSAWVPKPKWQKDPNCLMRTVSDLSALADPDTGFAVYDTYGLEQFGATPGWIVVGGTSLAAPLVSGMIGLAGNASALSDASHIYSHRSDLRDVIGGSNAGFMDCGGDYLCTALKGYDGPTGLGTPKGVGAL
jgi:subtilase family serine protease